MSRQNTENQILTVIDENGQLKRNESSFPNEVIKQSKVIALSSADSNSLTQISNPPPIHSQNELPPIESGKVTEEKPYIPDDGNTLDIEKLLKESDMFTDVEQLAPEPVVLDDLSTEVKDTDVMMKMEPLSEGDFDF